jgi:hypothetical protein
MRKLVTKLVSLLVVVLWCGTARAAPNGYLLLSPTSIKKDLRRDKVVLLFDLPCLNNRAVETATLIAASDDTGDMAITFGLAYPAAYCMDHVNDSRARPHRGYPWTISARKYGIGAGVTLKRLRPLGVRTR